LPFVRCNPLRNKQSRTLCPKFCVISAVGGIGYYSVTKLLFILYTYFCNIILFVILSKLIPRNKVIFSILFLHIFVNSFSSRLLLKTMFTPCFKDIAEENFPLTLTILSKYISSHPAFIALINKFMFGRP